MRDRATLRDKVAARISRRRDAVFLTREFQLKIQSTAPAMAESGGFSGILGGNGSTRPAVPELRH